MRDQVRKLLARFDLETQAAAVHYHVDEMTLEEVAAAAGPLGARPCASGWKSCAAVCGRGSRSGASHDPGATASDDRGGAGHAGELRLRRFRIGELAGADAQTDRPPPGRLRPDCRARLDALEDEQRAFAARDPVRALRRRRRAGQRACRAPGPCRAGRWIAGSGLALAAAAALVLVMRPGGGEPRRAATASRAARSRPRLRIAAGRPAQPADAGTRAARGPARRASAAPRATAPAGPAPPGGGQRRRRRRGHARCTPSRATALPVAAARDFSYLPDSHRAHRDRAGSGSI